MQETILPNIGDVWTEKAIGPTKDVRGRAGEFRGHCPFCGNTNYKLYLNTIKNTFRCFVCGERGGVAKFIGLLEGKSPQQVIEEIKQSHFKKLKVQGIKPQKRKNLYPAERLNAFQLKEMGYLNKPNWSELKQRNPEYARNLANMIWSDFQFLVKREVGYAFRLIWIYSREGKYQEGVIEIKKRSREIGHDLLTPALKTLSLENPPEWAIEEKFLALDYYNAVLNDKLKNAGNGQKKVAGQLIAG